MINEPRRVPKKNIWQVIYDIRPAVRSWEDEIKYRLRPRVVDFSPLYQNKLKQKYLIKEPQIINIRAISPPPRPQKKQQKVIASNFKNKKNIFVKAFPILIGLFVLVFTIYSSFNYHLRLTEERKNTFNTSMASVFDSLNQWRMGEAKAKLTLLGGRLLRMNHSKDKSTLARFLADLEPLYVDTDLRFLTETLNTTTLIVEKISRLEKIEPSEINSLTERLNNVFPDEKEQAAWREMMAKMNNFSQLLGLSGKNKVLLILENPDILRPDGGLMTIVFELTMEDGKISELTIIPAYELDKYFNLKLIPPLPLQLSSPNWLFHNLNWFLDTNFNGQLIAKYLETVGLDKDSKIFAFTDFDFLTSFLKIIGPITIDDLSVDALNGQRLMMKWAEDSKSLINNNALNLFNSLALNLKDKFNNLSLGDREQIFNLIIQNLNKGNLKLYSPDQALNNFIKEENWQTDLSLAVSPNDYLAISGLSLADNPLDLSQTKIMLNVEVSETGNLLNHLIIDIPHLRLKKTDGLYLKIYLPKDITIQSAIGSQQLPLKDYPYKKKNFEAEPLISELNNSLTFDSEKQIYLFKELNNTVVGAYLPLSSSNHFELIYQPPFKLEKNNDYRLVLEKPIAFEPNFSFKLKSSINEREIIKEFKLQRKTEINIPASEIYD